MTNHVHMIETVTAPTDYATAIVATRRAGERIGRPLDNARLIDRAKAALGRRIHRQKPGPKRRRTRRQEGRVWARR